MTTMRRRHELRCWRLDDFRLLFIETQMAAAAKIVRCTELNEKATIASNNFPGINRG
jgi:hypothetical protein